MKLQGALCVFIAFGGMMAMGQLNEWRLGPYDKLTPKHAPRVGPFGSTELQRKEIGGAVVFVPAGNKSGNMQATSHSITNQNSGAPPSNGVKELKSPKGR
jgi:hypothetical protein